MPDPLLRARDEGRVVFFCGAGVSQARAGLSDFFGLASSVMQELGAPEDSDAFKVLRKAREVGDELDVTGLISADRVFSLLERDFTTPDRAVQEIAPEPCVVLAFNCSGRRGKLRRPADELTAIHRALRKQVPLFDCYCAGEIGPWMHPKTRPTTIRG